jgi:hypothetical protein
MPSAYTPLTCGDIVSVIEGNASAQRVPVDIHFWVHPPEFGTREPQVYKILNRFPEDVQHIPLRRPEVYDAPDDDPEYRWMNTDEPPDFAQRPLDKKVALADWSQLDGMLEKFPDPDYPGMCRTHHHRYSAVPDGRYRLGWWFYCLFERHWSLRGMTNALMDYYINPKEVHRLYRALTDFYKRFIERGHEELALDGILTGDDLGTQRGPFFAKEIFEEFFKPYYREIVDKIHSLGMHFWVHSCGDISMFLPGLIEIGVDVIHPVQKGAMDQTAIAKEFGGEITFWIGLDVQHVIPWGTTEDVREEVRHLINTFWREGEGRMILTAGNGINGDCPLDSLEAFYDEAFLYGKSKVAGPAASH